MKVRLLLLFNGNIVRIERGMTLAAVASIVLPMLIQFFWPSSVVCLSVFLSFSLLLSLSQPLYVSICLSMSAFLSLSALSFSACVTPESRWVTFFPLVIGSGDDLRMTFALRPFSSRPHVSH